MSHLSFYLYNIYNDSPHPALGESPRQAYDASFQNTGLRLERLIPYDHDFTIATLPTTLKGTAMVCPSHGVKINYLFYWSEAMRDPMVERRQVAVRFDPYDAGTAYAFIGGQWVQCHSDFYRTFQGHSVKELLVGSQELRARARNLSRQRQVTGSRLAQLFESCEGDEMLFLQRLRDRERRVGGSVLQIGKEEMAALPAPTSTQAAEESQSSGTDQPDDRLFERF